MKKLILVLLLGCLSIGVQAQVKWFKATEVAVKAITNGSWSEWSEWQPVNIVVKFDITNDVVTIFTNSTQIYKIVSVNEKDSSEFKVIDQDRDLGTLKMRVDNNGVKQIYIKFNDIIWVYNLED